MKEPAIFDKSSIVIGVCMLLSTGLANLIASKASPQGFVQLKAETLLRILLDTGTVFLGLLSYLIVLWLRDLKRERVRFARETGRKICQCTETGEIMLLRTRQGEGGSFDAPTCPKCGGWQFPDEITNR